MNPEPTISPSEFIVFKCLHDLKRAGLYQMMLRLQNHEKQNASEWAYTTISAFLQRLIKKGYVERHKEDGVYLYQPTQTLWQAMDLIFKHYFGSSTTTFLIYYLQHQQTPDLNAKKTSIESTITHREFLVMKCLHQNGGAKIPQILSYFQDLEKKQSSKWANTTLLIQLKYLMEKGFVERSGKRGSLFYRPKNTLWSSLDVILKHYFGLSTHSLLISYLEHNRPSLTKEEKKKLDELVLD